MIENLTQRRESNLMPIACFIFGLWIVASIFSSHCLYADGAYEFVRVLEAQNFVAFMWSRHFAVYIYEFPLVLAIKLGVTSLAWLRLAFGLGCFLPWPVALFCCWRISPKNFWLAVAGCGMGYLNVAFLAVSEHILAHALFWPSLFAILFARPLNFFATVVLLASATGMLFSYESQAILCIPLALLALWRAWHEKKSGHGWSWVVFLLASALFFADITVGWCGVFMPELPANLGGFKTSTLHILGHLGWTFSWTVAWAGLVFLVASSEKLARIVSHKTGYYLLAVLFVIWGTWPLMAPDELDNGIQYDNRVLDLLIPIALLPVALILRFQPRWIERKQNRLVQLTAALLIAQSVWQIIATVCWYQDVLLLRSILASNRGIIPLHSTILPAHKMEGGEPQNAIGGRFDWNWPCLSVSLAPTPKINSLVCSEIFLNPTLRRLCWQPFDPLKAKTLPRLEHYDINFNGYITALQENAQANAPDHATNGLNRP
jgi:hypothetical protein